MNCIKKYKLPAIEALQFNGQLCIKLKDLWKVLHYMFNLAQNCQINSQLLNKMLVKSISKQLFFSKVEFRDVIKKCSTLSMPGPDHILWCYLKILTADDKYIMNFVNITNRCINLGYQTLCFKMSLSIIISKLNKVAYDFPKAF